MALVLETVAKQLEDSGIVAPGKLQNFMPPKANPKSAEDLLRELYKQSLLTKFQAQQVGAGKVKALILGNYTLLDRIGAGGMGQVFKAEHRRMHRLVAIKMLPPAMMKDAESIARFQREVTAAAKLRHPNIVAADDADEANGTHFLVMEYVEGSDLSAMVKKNGPFSYASAANYIMQAAKGLEFAHGEGVIHRDIKPANLLLDKRGAVKILDMGLARIETAGGAGGAAAELTSSGMVMGTVDYMAPEQALNSKHADARADIYSLGCSLYFLIAGKPTYEGDTMVAKLLAHQGQPIPALQDVQPGVPDELESIYRKMIAKSVTDRYQTMRDVAADLERFCGGQSTSLNVQQSIGTNPGMEQTTAFDSKVVSSNLSATSFKPVEAKKTKPSKSKLDNKKIIALAMGGVLAALLVVAGILVTLKTKDGTLIVEVDQPDATVQILNAEGKVEIDQKGGSGKFTIGVDPGKHRLKIEKDGFVVYSKNFEMESGGKKTISAKLERQDAAPAVASIPAPKVPSPTIPAPTATKPPVVSQKTPAPPKTLTPTTLPEYRPTAPGELVVCKTLQGKIKPVDVASGAVPFLVIGGDGRTGSNGIYVPPNQFDGIKGTEWSLFYSRAGSARGVHLVHPFGSGHVLVSFQAGSAGLVLGGTWSDRMSDSKIEKRLPAYETVFPFEPPAPRLITSRLSADGNYELLVDNQTIMTAMVTTVAPLTLSDRFVGQGLPMSWPIGSAGIIVGPLDKGFNKAEDVRLRPCPPTSPTAIATAATVAPPLAKAPFDTATARQHQQAWAKYLGTEVATTNSIGMKLILIPPGEFQMGTSDEQMKVTEKIVEETKGFLSESKREQPQHAVRISKPFRMGIHEVTVGQFRKFVEKSGHITQAEEFGGNSNLEKPSPANVKFTWRAPGYSVTDDSPVAQVSWKDACVFCNWLSEQEGFDRCYRPDGNTWAVIPNTTGYRLPTEAEWEYSCRAGTTTQYSFGDDWRELERYGWYNKNSGGQTQAVGSLPPNPFGLHDMHGNMWEWCYDWYKTTYDSAPQIDPLGSSAPSDRVLRGGCYASNSPYLNRTAYRAYFSHSSRTGDRGFRAVLSSVGPKPNTSNIAKPSSDASLDAWIKTVAVLPPEKQIEAVAVKLQELNPGFDGKMGKPVIKNGVVTDLTISAANNVTNISPLRALPGLKNLNCSGCGKLSDLSPLQGMQLTWLYCVGSSVADLSPLVGMPLTTISFSQTKVADLSPLRGMPLTFVNVDSTPVTDLSPLHDCKQLQSLWFVNTKVTPASVAALQQALPQCQVKWSESLKPMPTATTPPSKDSPVKAINSFRGKALAQLKIENAFPLTPLQADVKYNPKDSWTAIPEELQGMVFSYSTGNSLTTFEVTQPGTVLMAVTSRWGGGGSVNAALRAQLTTQQQLLDQGWAPTVVLGDSTEGTHNLRFKVFARWAEAGEKFSIGTEKYVPPVLIFADPAARP